jgi:hypothetical protein
VRPDVDTPARRATRTECGMAAIMVDLVRAGDLERAQACRDALAVVSVERSILSAQEHTRARRARREMVAA